MNILIAEDNTLLQELNSELMRYWGYSFDMASNGQEAVDYALANRGQYDVCLMDIEMPGMNGLEAAQKIRELTPYFPIAAYTGNLAYKHDCLALGLDEFVAKPCLPSELFGIITELTLKTLLISTDGEPLSVTKATPINSDELRELRDLRKRGLTKLKLAGLERAFFVLDGREINGVS